MARILLAALAAVSLACGCTAPPEPRGEDAAVAPPAAVPAVRFLPHPWARRLAARFGRPDVDFFSNTELLTSLGRAVGLPPIGTWSLEDNDEPHERGPRGISRLDWAYLRAGFGWSEAEALARAGVDVPAALRAHARPTLDQAMLLNPVVALVEAEEARTVDRGDGFDRELSYRVVESWRGDHSTGDRLIVRLPATPGPGRREALLRAPGARELLFASRPAYLVDRLVAGEAPSLDPRIVDVLAPLPVADGIVRSAPGDPGRSVAAPAEGIALAQLRARLRPLAARIEAALPRAARGEVLMVEAVDGRRIDDPVRLWFVYDRRTRRAVSGYEGCNWFSRNGDEIISTQRGCPRVEDPVLAPYRAAVLGSRPLEVGESPAGDPWGPIEARGNGHRLTLRRPLR